MKETIKEQVLTTAETHTKQILGKLPNLPLEVVSLEPSELNSIKQGVPKGE